MRILIGTNHMSRPGGTELWTRTMFQALQRDHVVHIFVADGPNIFSDMPAMDPKVRYDLALVNHNTTLNALRRANIGRVVFTSHGVLPELEWPVLGADAYVAVSDEVRDFIPLRSTIIRNPIDTDRFTEGPPLHSSPTRIAFLSNNESPAAELLREACNVLGAELRAAGRLAAAGLSHQPEDLMQWADVVVGVGRTALEGLSTGRNVYLLDQAGAAGMVCWENVEELGRRNWSGRGSGKWVTPTVLAADIRKSYNPDRNMRKYVVDNHHPRIIAKQYLTLASGIPMARRMRNHLLRTLPGPWTTKRLLTTLDPVLREVQRRPAPDGRPAVLSALKAQRNR